MVKVVFEIVAFDKVTLVKILLNKPALERVPLDKVPLDKVTLDKAALDEVTLDKVTFIILKSVSILKPIAARTMNKTTKKPSEMKATMALKIFIGSFALGLGQPVIALGIFPYFMK